MVVVGVMVEVGRRGGGLRIHWSMIELKVYCMLHPLPLPQPLTCKFKHIYKGQCLKPYTKTAVTEKIV